MYRRFSVNAPLNSKGTTSDWKNIKDCMRESEHFIITQRDGMWIIFFSDWLTSKRISKRKMAIQRKANTKERKKNQQGIQCWYHYILLMLVSVPLFNLGNENNLNIPILCCFHFYNESNESNMPMQVGKEPT